MIRTLIGKNTYALRAFVDERVADVLSRAGEFAIERIDASEASVDTILQAVQSIPFLVSEKLLVITSIQSNGPLMERLEELIDRTADGVEVILVEPALDKRKAGYKLLQKGTELSEFKEPGDRELPEWLSSYAREQGAKLTQTDAQYLVERVGASQQLLVMEVDKLALYNKNITRETIDILTDKKLQSTIFELLDASFSGNTKRALALYREQRQSRIEAQYILAMLVWQLQTLALAVHAPAKDEATLVSAGMSPFTARKALQATRSIDKARLKRMVKELTELDAKIKTSVDADAGIELFLLTV